MNNKDLRALKRVAEGDEDLLALELDEAITNLSGITFHIRIPEDLGRLIREDLIDLKAEEEIHPKPASHFPEGSRRHAAARLPFAQEVIKVLKIHEALDCDSCTYMDGSRANGGKPDDIIRIYYNTLDSQKGMRRIFSGGLESDLKDCLKQIAGRKLVEVTDEHRPCPPTNKI